MSLIGQTVSLNPDFFALTFIGMFSEQHVLITLFQTKMETDLEEKQSYFETANRNYAIARAEQVQTETLNKLAATENADMALAMA